MPATPIDPERRRLDAMRDGTEDWRGWGPYVSERQWGTVREDYSARTAMPGIISPMIRRAAARIAGVRTASRGFCDDRQLLCLSLALWNGRTRS